VHRIKSLSLIVVVALVLCVGKGIAQAQEPVTQKQSLTPKEMANAIVITNPADLHSGEQGSVYRLANCDLKDQQAPCYFTASGSGNFAEGEHAVTTSPMSSGATIVCGMNMYNGLGMWIAVLQQNVNVTFWGTYGRVPVTLNWGDLRGTKTVGLMYSWNGLTGPTPNPSWGTRTSTAAYAVGAGNLVYNPGTPGYPLTLYVSSRLTINTSGWYCK
jgi:hypothetical protein